MKTIKKDEFWQLVRGICIIAVILIHCKNGLEFEGNLSKRWNYEYWYVTRQFINFPVAIFIFLSGYFVNIKKVIYSKKDYIFKRLKGFMIPYFIWSIFYSMLRLVHKSTEFNFYKESIKVLIGRSATPLYYLLVLLQLVIITPYLVDKIRAKKNNVLFLLITPIYLSIHYIYSIFTGNMIFYYQLYFPAWFVFYYIGLYVKINGEEVFLKDKTVVYSIKLCFISLILSILEGYLLREIGSPIGSSQIKISSFIYSFSLINLLFILKINFKGLKFKILEVIGNNSFGIYFIHMFYIMVSNKILSLNPLIDENVPLYQTIQLFMTLSLSLVTIFVFNKLVEKNKTRTILGF